MARNKKASVNLDQETVAAPEAQAPEAETITEGDATDENPVAAPEAAPEPEEKKMVEAKKGTLMVCSTIKEDGQILPVGSVYKGNNASVLLKSGVLKAK